MRRKHALASALILSSLGLAWAQTPTSPSSPTGSEAAGAMGSGSGLSTESGINAEMRARMQAHMQAMRDLRSRMNAAGSVSDRQSLMDEHMRLMDENMGLMQQLMGPHMGGARGGMPMPMPTPTPTPGPAQSPDRTNSPGSVN